MEQKVRRWCRFGLWLCGCGFAVAADQLPEAALKGLGQDSFQERQKAEQVLEEWAKSRPKVAIEEFWKLSETSSDPEVRVRARKLLRPLVLQQMQGQGEGYMGVTMQDSRVSIVPGAEPVPAVMITTVMPRTPAAEKGVLPGDMILAINGKSAKDIGGTEGMIAAIRQMKPQEIVRFDMLRGAARNRAEVSIKLGRRPQIQEQNFFFAPEGVDWEALQRNAEDEIFEKWIAEKWRAAPAKKN